MKEIRNGRGTCLAITDDSYIRVGKDGKDVMIRENGRVFGFDTFDHLVVALINLNMFLSMRLASKVCRQSE